MMTRIILMAAITCGCSNAEPPAPETTFEGAPTVVGAPPQVAEETDEAPTVAIEAPVRPTHGGQIVIVGEDPLEVVVHEGGHVYAYPPSADLAEATVVVQVPVVEGAPRRLPLRWNGRRARFEGRLRRVEVAPGPVAVVFDHRGRHYDADIRIRLAPAIRIEVDAPRIEFRGKHRKHRARGNIVAGGGVVCEVIGEAADRTSTFAFADGGEHGRLAAG